MPIYRRKPEEVEAHYIPKTSPLSDKVLKFLKDNGVVEIDEEDETILLTHDWGSWSVRRGNFIFKHEDGIELVSWSVDSFLYEFPEQVGG